MKRIACGAAMAAFALAGVVPAASAQELSEVCPDSPDGTGAIWGVVSDEEGEMGLPGAGVVVTWEADGEGGSTEGQTGFDGGYVLCYVPLEAELAVQPTFGNTGGSVSTVSLTDPITRVDLRFTPVGAGGGGADDDRIWACFGGTTDNQINLQNTRLLRCDPGWAGIDRCPKEAEYGQVQATMTGGGLSADEEERPDEIAGSSDFREALEKLVTDAGRLGANAMINVRMNRNSLTAEAVTIAVDPETCR